MPSKSVPKCDTSPLKLYLDLLFDSLRCPAHLRQVGDVGPALQLEHY